MKLNSFNINHNLAILILGITISTQHTFAKNSDKKFPHKPVSVQDLEKLKNNPLKREIKISNKDVKAKVNADGIVIEIDQNHEKVEAKINKASPKDLANSSPSSIRKAVNRVNSKASGVAKYAVLEYPAEALGFYLALSAMSVWECMVNTNIPSISRSLPLNPTVSENPMACKDLMMDITDPVSHVIFALFIQTNKHTINMLGAVKQRYLDKYQEHLIDSMTKYIGLAAGSLVSTIAGEFITDPNIQHVSKNFFKRKNSIEQRIYDKAMDDAFTKWSPTNMSTYGHHVVSLLASAITAAAVTHLGMKGVKFIAGSKLAKMSKNSQSSVRQAGRKIVKKYVIPSFKFTIKIGSKTTTVGALAIEVASLLHFLFWEHSVYGPFITQLLSQEDSGALIKYHQSEIMKLLAQANRSDSPYSMPTLSIKNFLYDRIHSQENINIQQKNLSSSQIACSYDLSVGNNKDHFSNALKLAEGKSLFQENNVYTKELCPSLAQMPLLLDNNFTKNLSKKSDFTKLKSGSDVTLQESILENLSDHHEKLIAYLGAVGSKASMSFDSWRAFFEPYEAEFATVENFYSKLIEHKGKKFFKNGFDYWKSHGVINSIFHNVRTFEDALSRDAYRLTWENKLAELGVNGDVIITFSSNQLRPVFNILSNMKKLFGNKPNDERLAAIQFLNNGFNPMNLGKFKKFDYQLRNYAISLGLKKEAIEKWNSHQVEQVIDFIEELDPWDVSAYLFALNNSYELNQVQSLSREQLVSRLGGEQNILINLSIEMDEKMKKLNSERLPLISDSHKFNVKERGMTRHGIYYTNTLERILIDLTCGKSMNELVQFMTMTGKRRNTMIDRPTGGALQFNPPRLVSNKNESVCSYRKPGYNYNHVHNEFWDKNTKYANLLDFGIQNITMTEEEFYKWWDSIYVRNEPEYSRYFNKYKEAVRVHIKKAYARDDYGRASHGSLGRLFHIGKSFKTDIDLTRVKFANGIKYLSDDFIDYYLRVLALMIPRDDKEMMELVYNYIDAIRDLSINSDNYSEIRETYREYEMFIKDEKIADGEMDALSFQNMSDLDWHELVISRMLKDLRYHFSNEMALREDTNQPEITATQRIVDALIVNIESIFQQKATYSAMAKVLDSKNQ